MTNILSIDPGINTGWCLWDSGRKIPVDWGCISESKKDRIGDHLHRSYNMRKKMVNEICQTRIMFDEVVIESTQFWEKSHKSRNAARTGSLQFLTSLVGMYSAHFADEGKKVVVVPPTNWKGQLSDELVRIRVEMIFNRLDLIELYRSYKPNIHICCAIGIGAHYLKLKEFYHDKGAVNKKGSKEKKQ